MLFRLKTNLPPSAAGLASGIETQSQSTMVAFPQLLAEVDSSVTLLERLLDSNTEEVLTMLHQVFGEHALTQLQTASAALLHAFDGLASGAEEVNTVFDGQAGEVLNRLHDVLSIVEQIKPILDLARQYLA